MEGEMPFIFDNVGAGGNHRGDGFGNGGSEVQERKELTERQLMEKLEKSEAGRKKLRHAIVLLKEKLDVMSNGLEVNEVLRQEVEKERLNVDTERKRAEAERLLREKVEKESSAIKERLNGALQRLDTLERSCKAEFGRIRLEVKEAVCGIGARLHAVEAIKGLYQSLERSLHAKINGALQSSSKALTSSQSGQASMSGAHATALAAQSMVKVLQKEVQLMSSQVITLRNQAFNLSTLDASLKPELQLRGPDTPLNSPDSGEANVSLPIRKEKVLLDGASPSRSDVLPHVMVLSKNQIEVEHILQAKDVSSMGDVSNMLVASAEKSRSNSAGSTIDLPPHGGVFLSRNHKLYGGLEPQSTTPQTRFGIRSPRIEVVSRDESTLNGFLSQFVSSSTKKDPVAITTRVNSVLSPERVCALLHSASKPLPRARSNALQKQSEVEPQRFSDTSKGWKSREFSNNRWLVKGGLRDLDEHVTPTSGLSERSRSSDSQVKACDTFSGNMSQPDGKPRCSSTTKLLRSIIKMLEKEDKNRRSMEEKLTKLEGELEIHCGAVHVAQAGSKRKRESSKGKGDGGSEEEKRRHLPGKDFKISDFGLDDAVTSPSRLPCITEDKCILQEKEARQNHTQAQDRLSKLIYNFQSRCRREGLFEITADFREITHVRRTGECKDTSDVDICNDETGTETDLESTDDDLGEGWWAKKVLLSPISSNEPTS